MVGGRLSEAGGELEVGDQSYLNLRAGQRFPGRRRTTGLLLQDYMVRTNPTWTSEEEGGHGGQLQSGGGAMASLQGCHHASKNIYYGQELKIQYPRYGPG